MYDEATLCLLLMEGLVTCFFFFEGPGIEVALLGLNFYFFTLGSAFKSNLSFKKKSMVLKAPNSLSNSAPTLGVMSTYDDLLASKSEYSWLGS